LLNARRANRADKQIIEEGLATLENPRLILLNGLAALDKAGCFRGFAIDGLELSSAISTRDTPTTQPRVFVLDRAVYTVGRRRILDEHRPCDYSLEARAIEEFGESICPKARCARRGRSNRMAQIYRTREFFSKTSLSLPNWNPVISSKPICRHGNAQSDLSRGFDTGRFYFQNFSAAFHHSEIIVVAPEGLILNSPRALLPQQPENKKTAPRFEDLRLARARNAAAST